MTERNDTPRFTLNDIEVGLRLVPALAQHAQAGAGAMIGYADLLELTRLLHPRDLAVDRALPLGIRAKLAFVSRTCAAHGWPDLASLAVAKPDADAAAAQAAEAAAQALRAAVASFDWSATSAGFAEAARSASAAVPKRFKPRKERPADVAWYAYFCAHRAACAALTGSDKQEIINLLMAGLDPDSALQRVLAEKAALSA